MSPECPFCGHSNENTRITCSKCGMVLNQSEDSVKFLHEPPVMVKEKHISQTSRQESPALEDKNRFNADSAERAAKNAKTQEEGAQTGGIEGKTESDGGENFSHAESAPEAKAPPGFVYPPFFGYPLYLIPVQPPCYGGLIPWSYTYLPYVYPAPYPYHGYSGYQQPAYGNFPPKGYWNPAGYPAPIPAQSAPQPGHLPLDTQRGMIPSAFAGKNALRRRRSFWITMIVIFLLIIGGAAASWFVFFKGKGAKTFDLGNGTVVGADIEFKNMTLTQKGEILTLKGKYENNSRREGTVTVTLDVISSDGTGELLSFEIPVKSLTTRSFSKTRTRKVSIKSISIGALVLSSNSGSRKYESYPWIEEMQNQYFDNPGQPNTESEDSESGSRSSSGSNSGLPNYGSDILPFIPPQMQSNPELLRYLQNPPNEN